MKPIKSKRDYNKALKRIEGLMDARPNTLRGDELDVLATLVEAYEEARWPIDPPDPVEAIKFRMEQSGYTQADLAKLLGSRPRASEILKRKRALTVEMIWTISREWNIPAESLIMKYKVRPGAANKTDRRRVSVSTSAV